MRTLILATALAAAGTLAGCGGNPGGVEAPQGAAGHAAPAAEFERGPHRGRMLRDGDFALEVTIFETGVPPEFHLYAYRADKPLDPKAVTVTIELARLGGKRDRFTFTPQDDHLVGSGTVVEPHSFDVEVVAQHAGRAHRWQYASYEGRTSIPDAVATAAGVATENAGPAVIRSVVRLMGRTAINDDRHAEIRARYPGPVVRVDVVAGDRVAKGATLAIVENAESLRTYAVTAPFASTVLARHTNAGDRAGEAPLFEIADLDTVWVDLNAFAADAAKLAPGQPVAIHLAAGEETVDATLARILPIAATSQAVVVRAVLESPPPAFRPGTAVSADVTVGERSVPLAVKRSGLQRFRDFTVVFARFGDTYEVRMLELGEQDAEHVEVLGGIDPGTPYVTEQSFLIKADIDKSGASHDH